MFVNSASVFFLIFFSFDILNPRWSTLLFSLSHCDEKIKKLRWNGSSEIADFAANRRIEIKDKHVFYYIDRGCKNNVQIYLGEILLLNFVAQLMI